MSPIRVVCMVLLQEKKVLLAQRSETMKLPGMWEFPGGKVEPGESDKAALVREIEEELNLDIEVTDTLRPVLWNYPTVDILLIPLLSKITSGELICKEHSQTGYFTFEECLRMHLADADKPILEELKTLGLI